METRSTELKGVFIRRDKGKGQRDEKRQRENRARHRMGISTRPLMAVYVDKLYS